MATKKAASVPKPTLAELRAMGDEIIRPRIVDRLEEISVRLIQIQTQTKEMQEEEGYTDSSGVRHRGLRDELEELLETYELNGLQVEDYTVYRMAGGLEWLDKTALLNAGVSPEQIIQGMLSTTWTAVGIRKSAAPEDTKVVGIGRGRRRR